MIKKNNSEVAEIQDFLGNLCILHLFIAKTGVANNNSMSMTKHALLSN